MKKISLFVATLMMSLLMSISANAQRVWAYDLALAVEGEQYTFSYKAVTAGTATLVFTDVEGTELATVDLGTVEAGTNTTVLTASELPAGKKVNWAVKMAGDAIAEAELVTSVGKFYMPFGLGINNNPESNHFGKTYLANPWHEGNASATGFYVLDPTMVLDSTLFDGDAKIGYKPSNLTLKNTRYAIQRTAVSPVDGTVAFVQWEDQPWAVYGMNPDALNGEATLLTDTVKTSTEYMWQPVAVCYDYKGTLCVMAYDGKDEGGKHVFTIYSVVNGVKNQVYSANDWASVSGDNDIASDGQGGFWILNGKHDVSVGQLRHVTKNGVVDLKINQGTDTLGMPTLFRRVRIGYDLNHNVLAIGGNGKVVLYNASYDAEGKVSLTKWIETPMYQSDKPGWNTDGIAFDYAGDLVVISASSEFLYKYALPTENNVCTTPAAAKYAFELEGEEPEVEYQVYEDEITNLIFDLESWPMVCYGGPSTNFAVEVYLILGDEDGSGKYLLSEESSVAVDGIDATFIEGYLENIDVYAPKADAVIRCEWNGMKLELHLSMSSAPIEATVVVVENAIIEVEKYLLFGDTYEYALKMTGVWTDAEGLEYPVLVEVPVYYPEATEPTTIRSTVTVGGWGDDENWLGFGEGDLTVTTVGNTITATGVVNNPGTGVSIDITISGSIVPSGVENTTIMINSIKTIENGQLIIKQDGVKYNAQGTKL